ncbi:MAG: efflux RND transporter periplasmic adaptor subunit [Hyphomicrobiaceae bacterium]
MLSISNSLRRSAVARGTRVLAAALPLTAFLPGLPEQALRQPAQPAFSGLTTVATVWPGAARAETPAEKGKARYTCPMHPHYISDHQGTCPICGMDLVKAQAEPEAGAAVGESRQIVTIAPEMVQNMGVRIAPVERASFGRRVRATAMVMENERTRSVITARVEGWIEDLKITAVGDPVTKGMKLFEMFAPELVVSQRDYLAAMRTRDRDRLEATEARLRAFGVQEQAMRQLATEGREMQRLPFYADRDGIIAELPVVSGEYLKRGASVLRIQDYRTVWMVVNVAEKDLGLISAKTRVAVTFPNLPGRSFETHIDYIYPTIDAKTRTGRVRLVVDNKDGVTRPGSFADVSFEIDAEPRLAVKSEAILQSERGAYVVLARGEGRFEPRLIQPGLVSGGWTEVREGIAAGDQVVVSGQFLIDSESALKESFRKLERLQMPLRLLAPSKAELAMIDHFVDAAIYLHEALADGYDVEAKFLQPAREVRNLLWPRFGTTKLSFVIEDAAKAIAEAQSARAESEVKTALAKLVEAIKPWMMEGAPRHYAGKAITLFREEASGRQWVQRGAKPANPYGRAPAALVAWPHDETAGKRPSEAPSKEQALPAGHGTHTVPAVKSGG